MDTSSSRSVLLPLALFGVTVAAAVGFSWSATDVIWGLWASSLVTGFLFLGASLARIVRTPGVRALFPKAPSSLLRESRWLRLLVIVPGALFLAAFFTLHYGFFHFIHGVVLNGFFPLAEWNVFGTTPDESLAWFVGLAERAVTTYWPVVAAAALARGEELRQEIRELRESEELGLLTPYLNVLRIHFFIGVLAALTWAGAMEHALYAVLLFFFFPVERLVRRAVATRV